MQLFYCRRRSVPLAAVFTALFYATLAGIFCALGLSPLQPQSEAVKKSLTLSVRLESARIAPKLQAEQQNPAQIPTQKSIEKKVRAEQTQPAQATQKSVESDIGETSTIQAVNNSEILGAQAESIKNAFLSELDGKIRQNLLYPERARIRNAEGTVTALISISENGSLRFCRLEQTSGSSLLDDAALTLLGGIFPLAAKPPYAFETSIKIAYRLE